LKEKYYNDKFKDFDLYKYDNVIDFKQYLKGYSFNSLLEVGCGNGRNLNYFRDFYPDIFLSGCDLSSVGIDVCKQNGFDALCCNAENIPIKSNSYDAVLTVHSLEQMKYIIEDVVSEISRISKHYVFCFEPIFSLQNIFGKYHNFSMDYVRGLPYIFEKHFFNVIELRNLRLSSFRNSTCLLVLEKRIYE